MPDQNAECGIGRSHFARSVGGKALRCSGNLLFIILLALPASHAEQSPPTSLTPPEQAVSEIENYINEIRREEDAVNQALQAVSRASSDPSGFSAQWTAKIAPRGARSLTLFSNPTGLLTSWVTSIRDGSDRYPPLDEIRAQMAEWRGRVSRLKEALGRVADLEERRNKIRVRLSGLKPESSEWLAERREEGRIDEEIRATLSAAQSEAESSLKIRPPISPSDRTRSPFDGPVNPGPPTSLWIWTEKASTLIGDTINTQVGLANDAGPNCKADKTYSVQLDCQGCTINNPEITIREGDTYSQTNIRVTDRTAVVKASSKELKRNQVNLKGCASAKDVRLVITTLPGSPTRGPADGVTRLKYDLVFQDSEGQPATNKLLKHIPMRLVGVGTIEIDDKQAGAIRSNKDGFRVPPDECSMGQAIFSDLVGQSTVMAEFRGVPAAPLTFTFDYAFPRLDIIFMVAGAVLGYLTRFFSRGSSKTTWWKSALYSFVGSFVLMVGGYYILLSSWSPGYSYLFAGGFTLFGGFLGLGAMRLWPKFFKGSAE